MKCTHTSIRINIDDVAACLHAAPRAPHARTELRTLRGDKERPCTRNVEHDEYDEFLAFARARGTTAKMLVAAAVLTYLTNAGKTS